MTITQQRLIELFEYRNGNLYRKTNSKKTGSISSKGYRVISINNKHYREHRLIFLMFHGWLPEEVDHKDLNKSNNKIENLRPATSITNKHNQKVRSTNKLGIKNVYKTKDQKKFRVQIVVFGKIMHFGTFDDIELAELVAIEARDKYFKEFARN